MRSPVRAHAWVVGSIPRQGVCGRQPINVSLFCKSVNITLGEDLKKERKKRALAGAAQWTEFQPANQEVVNSISRQGTCLGRTPGPHLGACERQPIYVCSAH